MRGEKIIELRDEAFVYFKDNIHSQKNDLALTNWDLDERSSYTTKESITFKFGKGTLTFDVWANGYMFTGDFDYDQPSEDEMEITSITVEMSEYTFEGLEDEFLTDEEVESLCRDAEKVIEEYNS